MSAPSKRGHHSPGEDSRPAKISKNCVEDDKLGNFLKWCKEKKFYISAKVCVERERVCAQYGMVATEDITAGEVLFSIPRHSLLSPETCSIAPLLKKAQKELGEESGWVPLLLALLYECNNPQSPWRPYLDLVPDFSELDLPMFWSKKEREELLAGTGVEEAVLRDLQLLEKDFMTRVMPFMQKHPDVFSPACQSLELYMKIVAFVMAYSFHEPAAGTRHYSDIECGEDDDEDDDSSTLPVMVPLADILNHVASNNAALTFGEDALSMKSVRDIKKGEEVFNTYGDQSNKGLLHMYGFAQCYPDNHYDTVDIPACVLIKVARELSEIQILEAKLSFLQKQDLLTEGDSYTVGNEGVLTDDVLKAVLKVLEMSEEEFKEHEENEGWSEAESVDDDDDRPSLLSFENIPHLQAIWKKILFRCAEVCLSQLGGGKEQDARDMLTHGKDLPRRERYSLFVRFGQRQLLQQLLDACT